MVKKKEIECQKCMSIPFVDALCDEHETESKGYKTIKLITRYLRGIASKIDAGIKLTEEDLIFTKNSLRSWADSLDRKSEGKANSGVNPNESELKRHMRLKTTSSRVEKEFARLSEKPFLPAKRGPKFKKNLEKK